MVLHSIDTTAETDVHEFDFMIVARVTVCGIIVCVLLLACFHVLVCQTSKSLCAKQQDSVLCLCYKAVVESNDNNTVDVINRCKCEKIDRPRIIDGTEYSRSKPSKLTAPLAV